MTLKMLFKTVHTNFFDILSVEPLYDSVLDFTHATQISKVLLMLVSMRSEIVDSIIVSNLILVWKR